MVDDHSDLTCGEFVFDFSESGVDGSFRSPAVFIDAQIRLVSFNSFRSCQIIPGSAVSIQEVAEMFLAAAGTTHTKAVDIDCAVAIGIHCALLADIKELFDRGRNFDAGGSEDRRTIVDIQRFQSPGQDVDRFSVGSASHNIPGSIADLTLVSPAVNIGSHVGQKAVGHVQAAG